MIYMRQGMIGGIGVRHDQKYIDENSNYDDLWERFVTVTDIRNGREFAYDEANETIYWSQVRGYLPDFTPIVRFQFFRASYFDINHGNMVFPKNFSMRFAEYNLMEQTRAFSMVTMRYSWEWRQEPCKSMQLGGNSKIVLGFAHSVVDSFLEISSLLIFATIGSMQSLSMINIIRLCTVVMKMILVL